MALRPALEALFEEAVAFRTDKLGLITDPMFMGATPVSPVDVLRGDAAAYTEEFDSWYEETWAPEQELRRESLLRLHSNAARYDELRRAVHQRQVAPFIGSGMCVPSGLLTWGNLLRAVRTATRVGARELDRLLKDFAFEEAADLLCGGATPRLFNEQVEHHLRLHDSRPITGAIRLLPALFPDLVLTTNLDQVLERRYQEVEHGFHHVLAGGELASYRGMWTPNERFLLKLHGDHQRPDTRVLTTAEYNAAYRQGGTVRSELETIYKTKHLLFLGCSLGVDRTVQLITTVAAADPNMPRHYAFVPCPRRNSDRVDRENMLAAANIFPIWYTGDHDEALIALLSGLLLP